jgi:hypothetical protein
MLPYHANTGKSLMSQPPPLSCRRTVTHASGNAHSPRNSERRGVCIAVSASAA